MEHQRVLSGRYALISHLARGGMADVYVAEDRRLGRQVAVKILHDQYASNEAFVERFRREAQAAANLTHSGVVAVHDWGEDDGTYFMVMELVQGRNLRDIVRTEGAMPPRRVAEIGAEVAAALSASHAQGLVHRDVKPANILLTPDGSVKVADFGIARAFDDTDDLTRTGAVIGTATYFSPEQAQGHGADSRSDIYSLGVVMYELLTGQPPFQGESSLAVAYQHVGKEPTPPSKINPKVPRALEVVVLRAMAKDPEQRYPTAADLGSDLRRLLSGQVPTTEDDDAPTRVMAAAGAGTQAVPPPPSTEPAEPAYREPGRLDTSTIAIGILAGAALLGLGILLLFRLLGGSDGGIEIPDVRGQAVAVARANLEDLGLIVGEERIVADAEIEAGLAAGTEPPAGERAERGDTIGLLVSGGPADTEVPDVLNQPEDDARALIRAVGLQVGDVTYEPADGVTPGLVISQNPQGGEMVIADSAVHLVVAAGGDALTVPNVVNRTEEDAIHALSLAGFGEGQIVVARRPHGTVLEGFVIETDPAAGESVPITGTVTVYVSEGAVPTVVPSVIGRTPLDAAELLEEWGFEVVEDGFVDVGWDDPNDGLVAEQDPEAGEILDFGSPVTIRIGRALTEATVPDVVGETEADALSAIEDQGLTMARGADVHLEPGDPDIGRVITQSPDAGTNRPIGATVTVTIGVEGAVVPDLFTGASGACPTAVTLAEAQTRVTDADLTLSPTVLPSNQDEYFLRWNAVTNQFDPTTRPECEGRAVSQSPSPGTVVAPDTAVVVSFDPVLAPAAADIYGRTIAQVTNAYQDAIVWLVGASNAGECHDPGGTANLIRLIEPAPGQSVDFNVAQSQYEAQYWRSVNNPARPPCPPLP